VADNIIEAIIRAKDEASRAFLAAASNADKLASEQAAVTKSGNALDQQAADTAAALERQAQASEEAARAAAALAAQQAKPGPQRGPDGRFLPRGQQGADGSPTPGPMPSPSPIPPIPDPDPDGSKADQIKNLSGRVMTLRYNLMDVGQQLAGGGSPFMVLMQQGPEIAAALGDATEAAEVLKASFGGMLTKLAPVAGMLAGVAIAAAALVTAMIALKNATTDADDANGRLGARLLETGERAATAQEKIDGVRLAIAGLRAANKDAEIGLKELTGEIDRYAAQSERSRIALDDQVESKRRDIALTIEQQKAHIDAVDAKMKDTSVLNSLTESQREEAAISRQTAAEKLAAAEKERDELGKLYTERLGIITATEEYGRALAEEKDREEAANKARQESKRHLSELKAKYDDLVKALDAFQDRERLESALSVPADLIPAAAIQSARDLEAAINQIAPPQDVLDDYQRLTLLLSDAQRLAASNPGLQGWADDLSGQVADALVSGAAAGMEGVAKDLRGLMTTLGAEYAKAVQRGARVGGAIGDVLGGDITGALSKGIPALAMKFADAFAGQDGMLGKIAAVAGPYGAAIGAAISGITALGQQGAGATSKSLMSGVDGLIAGFKMLPALVRKFIPDLVVTLITELIPALIANVPRMFVAILIELPVAIVRGIVLWWRDIGGFRGIARSIADGVREWWRETWDRVKSWFKDIFTPGDQGRGRNRRNEQPSRFESATEQIKTVTSGIGEVFSRTGSPRGRPMQAGPTLVLQAASLHPDVVPRALRDLDRMTRPGGLRRGTTVLGGT
jgi:hypothetical protein